MLSRIPKIKALPDAGTDVARVCDRAGLAEDDGGEDQWPLGVPSAFAYAFEFQGKGGDKAFSDFAWW